MPFTHRAIAVNDITLNVIIEGTGPTVLLVHGFPDDHRVWREQIPALVAAGYRVVAPDMRGCGDSDAPPDRRAYRMERLVADLAALLDEIGIDKVRLVGHDWGAVIGWQFAMHHPSRVECFAALSVGHPQAYAKASLEQKLKGYYVLMFQLRGLAEALLRAGNWRLMRGLTRHPESAHWIERLSRPGRLTAALNYYRANLGIIVPRAYPALNLPILGVWSQGDRFLTEQQMQDSSHYVQGSWRYARINGASHWLQLDAPDQINTLLLDFFQSPAIA